jgi:hypothetical protein
VRTSDRGVFAGATTVVGGYTAQPMETHRPEA